MFLMMFTVGFYSGQLCNEQNQKLPQSLLSDQKLLLLDQNQTKDGSSLYG